jgi:hypothetical protein
MLLEEANMFDFFDRFSTGFSAASDCWDVLKKDKKLLVFPLVSGLACFVVLLSFAIPIAVLRPQELNNFLDEEPQAKIANSPVWFWLAVFAFYFCNYFVIYFFNAALIHCALFRFRGMELSVNDGFWAATRCLPQILGWALVSATVGVTLKIIESSSDFMGRLVSAVLGMTWTVVTYFVLPVLIVEKVGPIRAVGRSAKILSETWGEALGGRMGIGWFLLPFWLIGILLLIGGFTLLHSVLPLGIGMIAVAIATLLLLGLVGSALETILLSGLYLYATQGEVPAEMNRGMLQRAFTARESD